MQNDICNSRVVQTRLGLVEGGLLDVERMYASGWTDLLSQEQRIVSVARRVASMTVTPGRRTSASSSWTCSVNRFMSTDSICD